MTESRRHAPTRFVGWFAVGVTAWLAGCDSAQHATSGDAPAAEPAADGGSSEFESSAATYQRWADPLLSLPYGSEQIARVCARGGDDALRNVFCVADPPAITGLADIETALHLDSQRLGGLTGLSMTAHSTALAARSVSSINPRVIIVQLETPKTDLIALAFARGEQFLEVVVRERSDATLRFYLVAFKQACNDASAGCSFGDLLTPAIEHDWTQVSLYDEQDVSGTVLDCAPCHQPAGPGTSKLLRMQELEPPWTHWFFQPNEGGGALFADYLAAKAGEPLAGLTPDQLDRSHPGNLNMLVTFGGFRDQPNAFASQTIEDEVRVSAAANGGMQPLDNSIPGRSATWLEIYQRAQRGEAMTVPYHDVKITDPSKLERMTEAYQAYRRGELQQAELPDIRDVLPDDPARLAEMGLMTEPGLDGPAVLLQACSLCHNEQLDQTLSRARFRANLHDVDRAEKDAAIARLMLPPQSPLAMPPRRLRWLSAEARARAIEALRR